MITTGILWRAVWTCLARRFCLARSISEFLQRRADPFLRPFAQSRYAVKSSARDEFGEIFEVCDLKLAVEYLQRLQPDAFDLEQVEHGLRNLGLDLLVSFERAGFEQFNDLFADRFADAGQFAQTRNAACLNHLGKRRRGVFNRV